MQLSLLGKMLVFLYQAVNMFFFCCKVRHFVMIIEPASSWRAVAFGTCRLLLMTFSVLKGQLCCEKGNSAYQCDVCLLKMARNHLLFWYAPVIRAPQRPTVSLLPKLDLIMSHNCCYWDRPPRGLELRWLCVIKYCTSKYDLIFSLAVELSHNYVLTKKVKRIMDFI